MHDLRPPYFFSTKKNPAAARKVEGVNKLDLSASSMYFSIVLFLGVDKGYTLLLGGLVPGSRSTVQSHGR